MMVSEARRGIALNDFFIERINIEGQVYWFLDPKVAFDFIEKSGEVLLPAFDEMLCGYKDKSAVLSLENVKSTILRNGIIRPILVVESWAVGTWKWSRNKEKVVLDTPFSHPLTNEQKNSIKNKAKKLEVFYKTKN
jgi:hypothetical protein